MYFFVIESYLILLNQTL